MAITGNMTKLLLNRYVSVVILAAGSSSRMGFDKMFAEISGVPVIAKTISAFNSHESIDEIIVVTRDKSLEKIAEICRIYNFDKVRKIVLGADTRAGSSLAGICESDKKANVICVQDGARPFPSKGMITDVINAAYAYKAAAPAISPKDTIKTVSGNYVSSTLNRKELRCIQTPQAFDSVLIKAALTKALEDQIEITDDCSAVEVLGVKPYLTAGDEKNIKLTTPEDIMIAELYARDERMEINVL